MFLLTNCKNSKSVQEQTQKESLENFALLHFNGKEYEVKENKEGDYAIVYRKDKKLDELMASVVFFIFEESTQSAIFQDKLNAGSVEWLSDTEIIAIARNVKVEGNTVPKITYYYDVLKKQKRTD